jgi:hypothetical protein
VSQEPGTEALERQIMGMLLAGAHPTLVTLRQQYAVARVVHRDHSGVGVFTHFDVPTEAPRTEPANFSFGDLQFQLEGTENPGSGVLFVRNGCLKTLELWNWSDDWPEVPVIRSVTYLAATHTDPRHVSLTPSATRDEAWLEEKLSGG